MRSGITQRTCTKAFVHDWRLSWLLDPMSRISIEYYLAIALGDILELCLLELFMRRNAFVTYMRSGLVQRP